jgi:hypothetical protein
MTMADPTNKLTALQQLSQQIPVASSRAAQQQQAARDIQLQQAVAKAPTTAPVQQTAAQVGAAQAQTTGQQAVQAATNQIQQQGQIAQQGQAVQQMADRKDLAQSEMGLRNEQQSIDNRLAQISLQGKQELFDKNIKFERDEIGRAMLNQDQLDDYVLSKARTEQDWANYQQQVEQAYKRKQQFTDYSMNKLSQELQQQSSLENLIAEREQDVKLNTAQREAARKARLQIANNKLAIEQQLADFQFQKEKEQADAANRAAKRAMGGQIIGTVLGAAVGTLVAPGAGTAAGASFGASLGGSLGGAVGASNPNNMFGE